MGCSWCKSKRKETNSDIEVEYDDLESESEEVKHEVVVTNPFQISHAWLIPFEKQNIKERVDVTNVVKQVYQQSDGRVALSKFCNELRKHHSMLDYTHLIITFSVDNIKKAFGHSYSLKQKGFKFFPVSCDPEEYKRARANECIQSVSLVFKKGRYCRQRDITKTMQVFTYDNMRQFLGQNEQRDAYTFV